MRLSQKLQELLLKIHEKLPPDKAKAFAGRIKQRLHRLQVDDLAGYTIAGALVGTVCEILPLDVLTGIDDWVEVGAALGASVGYLLTAQERRACKEFEAIIQEELSHD